MTRRSAGVTLVEVLVALAIIGGVLIGMAGLFAIGTRQLASGRRSSIALAVARDALEELGGVGFAESWQQFGCDGGDSACTVDTSISAADSVGAAWQSRLDAELDRARTELRFESFDGAAQAAPLDDADFVRVTVTVFWSEGLRSRRLDLAMVRM